MLCAQETLTSRCCGPVRPIRFRTHAPSRPSCWGERQSALKALVAAGGNGEREGSEQYQNEADGECGFHIATCTRQLCPATASTFPAGLPSRAHRRWLGAGAARGWWEEQAGVVNPDADTRGNGARGERWAGRGCSCSCGGRRYARSRAGRWASCHNVSSLGRPSESDARGHDDGHEKGQQAMPRADAPFAHCSPVFKSIISFAYEHALPPVMRMPRATRRANGTHEERSSARGRRTSTGMAVLGERVCDPT